jgi:pimeloyl-ACP methyl ester carboxylesterase
MMRRPLKLLTRFTVIALLVLALTALALPQGCASWIGHAIVDAPNAGREISVNDEPAAAEQLQIGIDHAIRANVGPPSASLSIWIINPSSLPRGSVLVLHGIRDSKRSQIATGKLLADTGYRAILVDLRGHGLSNGQWLTYGVVESRDLKQVLDELEATKMLVAPVGAVGSSYDGAAAIQLAAIDPRIKAVVATAAFTSLPDLIPQYTKTYGFGWAVSDSTINRGIDRAGELANFDPYQASPLNAIAHTQAHVLLIHGKDDKHIPCEHSERLHAAAPDHSKLLLIDDENHDSIMADRSGTIAKEMRSWLAEWLR